MISNKNSNLNFIFILLSVFLSFGISETEILDDNERLINAVSSEKFNDFFRVCEMEDDTIKIYHNFENFAFQQLIELKCGKTLNIERKIIEFNINSTDLNRPKFMILYKFEKRNRKYEFRFLDVRTNGNLILAFNRKNKLVDFEGGNF
jgi:hypothetical protein